MPAKAPRTNTLDLIALADASAETGVHPRTIRRWIADGRLPGYRLGPRLLRVDRAELHALARRIPTAGGDR